MIDNLLVTTIDMYEVVEAKGTTGSPIVSYEYKRTIASSDLQPIISREFKEGKNIGEEIYNVFVLPSNTVNYSDKLKYNNEFYEIIKKVTWHNVYLQLTIRKVESL